MIEDINDTDFKEVPGSQFVVSRTAFKVLNIKSNNFIEIHVMLKTKFFYVG
jgi:hypothetical protein